MSRPTMLRPLTARAFAESPSVRMRVHLSEFRVPALLASSSFGMPVIRERLAPSFFFRSFDCLKLAQLRMLSTTPHLPTFFMKSGEAVHLEPKLEALSVSVSLV